MLYKLIAWVWKNKIKSSIYLIIMFIVFDYFSLPGYSIEKLVEVNPLVTALMQQRHNENEDVGKKNTPIQNWVPINRISEHLIHAIIVAEDGTFYEHGGVDWFEVRESIEKNLEKGKTVRGASTITQQLAKNLYLSTSKDPLRKLKELIITLRMERILTKQRILEIYLNVIEWGEGIYGVEAASQKYFGKPASMLERWEAVRLVAVVPNPLKHKPTEQSRWLYFRTKVVLDRMEARGW